MSLLWHRTLRMLLLLIFCLPLGVKADTVKVPFMCIEKTNGEIVKIPITDNAPSVWYSSEGPDWKYDYETFVAFDVKGRAQYAEAVSKPSVVKKRDTGEQHPADIKKPDTNVPYVAEEDEHIDKQLLPLPPKRMKGTWKDALQHPTSISELRKR